MKEWRPDPFNKECWDFGYVIRGIIRDKVASATMSDNGFWHWFIVGTKESGIAGSLIKAIEACEIALQERDWL